MTDSIASVAIVGAGTMGRRIAFACAAAGIETRLFDIDPEAAARTVTGLRRMLEERVGSSETAGRTLVSHATSLTGCVADADLVIEAVPERVDLKRRVFAEIAPHLAARALVSSNTSSIPGSWLADASGAPERFVNMNFGPLDDRKVEIMGTPRTAGSTIEQAVAFVRRLGLVPIVARREILGYVTNRVWRAVKKEVLFLLDQGYATRDDIDRGWMLDWGTTAGPCGLMDEVGLDVVRDIERMYHHASGDPSDRPPPLLDEMIAAGKLGVKSGAGFYTYPDPAYRRPGWLDDSAEG